MKRGRSRTSTEVAEKSPRVQRVSNELQRILADSLERRLDADGSLIATITAVVVDPDLRRARIYFDSMDSHLTKWLKSNRHNLQHDIATRTRIRNTPLLEFFQDPAIVIGTKVESILRDISERENQVDNPAS